MSKMKKFAGLLLALVMVFAMAITASAEDSTPVNVSTHTFDAYQIFSGNWDTEKSTLEAIEWGTGVDGAALLTELTAQNAYKDCNSAAAVAKVVSGYAANSAEAKAFAVTVAKHLTTIKTAVKNGDTIDAGYYLIVDTTNTANTNDAKNLSLLSVGTTVTITSKNSYPTVEKKVQDINDSETNAAAGALQDSADYDIGDAVPFTLTGTLPSDYETYKTYKYVFHDKQSDGLDAPQNIVVTVGGKTLTVDTDYRVVTTGLNDGCTFEIVINDLKTAAPDATASSKVIVTYTSVLNENAKLGAIGNPNKVALEYSNNPNAGGEGETGKTPEDKVIVFTYKVVVNKFKNAVADGNELPGAEFTLSKVNKDNTQTVVKTFTVDKNTAGTEFTFKGLDDGTYVLTETVTPAGYNTIDPITFTVSADHDATWEQQAQDKVLTGLSGNAKDGVVTFTAIDDEDSENVGLSTDVINKSGATLPTTGGMGTTMFYLIGALCVVCAGVLLISKKRVAR